MPAAGDVAEFFQTLTSCGRLVVTSDNYRFRATRTHVRSSNNVDKRRNGKVVRADLREVKAEVPEMICGKEPLNQRVPGSSPGARTKPFKNLAAFTV
jgi:hypothetical protein